MSECATCGNALPEDGSPCPHCAGVKPPSINDLDPVLYARFIMLLKDKQPERAVQVAEKELNLAPSEAAAYIQDLWVRYRAQIHPSDVTHQPSPWPLWVLIGVLIAALIGVAVFMSAHWGT